MAGNTAAPAAAVMSAPFARTSLPGRIVFGDSAVPRLADELDQHDLSWAGSVGVLHVTGTVHGCRLSC
jgi:hypothetical protein